jgi:hypothetical protein
MCVVHGARAITLVCSLWVFGLPGERPLVAQGGNPRAYAPVRTAELSLDQFGLKDGIRAVPLDQGALALLIPGDSARFFLYDKELRLVAKKRLGFRGGVLRATDRGVEVMDVASGVVLTISERGEVVAKDSMRLPSQVPTRNGGPMLVVGKLAGAKLLMIEAMTSATFDSDSNRSLRVGILDARDSVREIARTSIENKGAQFIVPGGRVTRSFFGRLDRFGTSTLIRNSPSGHRILTVSRTPTSSGRVSARVVLADISSDTIFATALRGAAVTLDPRFSDSIITFHAKVLETKLGSRELAIAAMRAKLHVGPEYPAVLDALIAQDGAVWLEVPVAESLPSRWRVMGADAKFSRDIELPRKYQMLGGAADRFWTISEDAGLVSLTLWRSGP